MWTFSLKNRKATAENITHTHKQTQKEIGIKGKNEKQI